VSNQPPQGPPEGWDPPSGGQQGPGQGWGQQTPGGPYGQPTGQQPTGWGPGPATSTQQPPKKSRGRTFAIGCLGLVGVFVLLGVVAALAGGGDDGGSGTATDQASPTTAKSRTTEAQAEEAVSMGDAVRDGKFEFVVSKVDCGKTRLGDTNFGKDAQGQFCVVNVKVENIGREAQTLDASSQYLYGSGGQRFDADTEAALYLGVNQTRTFLEDINPGNSVNGILVFDIPKNEKPTKIELHDSPFSGGVTVEL
jgi:Domain of unknown function (DUF4352)